MHNMAYGRNENHRQFIWTYIGERAFYQWIGGISSLPRGLPNIIRSYIIPSASSPVAVLHHYYR